MTASLFLLILNLALLQNLLPSWNGTQATQRLWAVALSLLLMMFSSVVPISHFMFVGAPKWLVWPSLIIVIILYGRITISVSQISGLSEKITSILLISGYAVWIIVATLFSAPESGPTPKVWDSYFYVANWVAVMMISAAILFAYARMSHITKTWRIVLTTSYITFASTLVFYSV